MSVVRQEDAPLALHGGQPVRTTMLPYGHQEVNEQDIREVVEVLRSTLITTGPKVGEFEEAFAAAVGARYAVSFSSGTAALHGAAFAAGLQPGDEAITTPMTFCATANCALYQGARPVFADVLDDTLNIDPREVARRITPRTKAIVPVDYAGHPARLEDILELADHHGLAVIEDACHALGAAYRGRRIGSVSHLTVFSFHPIKHITTGEGGMVVTDDARYGDRLRLFLNHGLTRDASRTAQEPWYYEMTVLGWNYRLDDIACALGRSQLRRLESSLIRRRHIAERYTEALRLVRGIRLPSVRQDVSHAWHLYPIRIDGEQFGADRGEVVRALRKEQIGVAVHYIPVHLHPYYRTTFGYDRGECPVAERAYGQLLSLPLFPSMTDRDIEDVICAVRKVSGHFATAKVDAG